MNRKRTIDFTEGKITGKLLLFALPILIGNVFNLAYNMADIRIIGSFLGSEALAAVGSVSTLSDLITSFLFGFANGFAVITSQQFGARNEANIRRTFAMSLSMGAFGALFISALSLLFLPQLLSLIHVEAAYQENAIAYLTPIFSGLVFSFLYNVMAANLRAIGDAYTPLMFLIFSACLNMALDYSFVGLLNFGVRGAALATVLSQLTSVILCGLYIRKKHPLLHISRSDFLPSKEFLQPMLSSGFSMALMGSLVHIGTVSLQSAINGLGENTIVAHAATRKLTSFFMMPQTSVATAMSTLCGQNYGAKRMDRIRKGLILSLSMGAVWDVFVILIANTICGSLITLITSLDTPEIIHTAVLYQRVDTAFYLVPMAISILRNSLQGMNDRKTPVVSSALETVVKMTFAFVLTPIFGYYAIIATEPVVWCIMVIPLIVSTVKRVKYTA